MGHNTINRKDSLIFIFLEEYALNQLQILFSTIYCDR